MLGNNYQQLIDYCIKKRMPFVFDETMSLYELVRATIKALNEMISDQNELKDNIKDFINAFENDLQNTVIQILEDWELSGRLEDIINQVLFETKADKEWVSQQIQNESLTTNQKINDLKDDLLIANPTSKEKTFGLIPREDGFYKYPFNAYHDSRGYYSDFNSDHYFGENKLYISKTGNNTNTGDINNPLRTIGGALDKLTNTQPIRIILKDKIITRLELAGFANIGNVVNNVSIEGIPGNNTVVGEIETNNNLVITTSSNIFKINKSSGSFPNINGMYLYGDTPSKLKRVSTVADVKNNVMSWTYFEETDTLYVNTPTIPKKEDIILMVGVGYLTSEDISQTLRIKDLTILSTGTANNVRVSNLSGISGRVIFENLNVDRNNNGNDGVSTYNVKETYCINVNVNGARRDGFNYHNNRSQPVFVYEENCSASDCGILEETNNNNITSAHDGTHILRLNTKGSNSKGPGLADVNGSYSVNYGCEIYETIGNFPSFIFTEDTKVRLYNCMGGTDTTEGLLMQGINDKIIKGSSFTSIRDENN